MALETLVNVVEIGGFEVAHMTDGKKDKDLSDKYIRIRDKSNSIAFTLQNGPIKENGVNGCQVETMIMTSKYIIEGLNSKFPCMENDNALYHLSMALKCIEARRKDREMRNVEGMNKL
jgi:hypothetical protein